MKNIEIENSENIGALEIVRIIAEVNYKDKNGNVIQANSGVTFEPQNEVEIEEQIAQAAME